MIHHPIPIRYAVLALAVVLVGCSWGQRDGGAVGQVGPTDVLPDEPVFEGWVVDKPTELDVSSARSLLLPEGRIGELDPRGVARLVQRSPEGVLELTVQAWQMPSALHAAAAAADSRQPEAEYLPAGWECFVTSQSFALAWGRLYIEGRLNRAGPLGRVVLDEALSQVRACLQRVPLELPAVFSLLPDRHLVLHSSRWDPSRTFFGVRLQGVVWGTYRLGRLQGELYLVELDTPAEAERTFRRLAEAHRWDRPLGGLPEQGVYGRDDLLGPVSVARVGRFLVLISGFEDRRGHARLASEAAVSLKEASVVDR